MDKPTFNDMMNAYSEDAIEIASKSFGKTLDYSEDSLKVVESILDNIYKGLPRGLGKFIKKKQLSDDIELMTKVWGGYIGEVIRRKWGGNWSMDNKDYPGVLTLKVFETYIFPPAKVYKRLTNGSMDNIWFYYQVLSDGFANSKNQNENQFPK